MEIRDFDYELPQELIAQEPIEPRDASRLMVLMRSSGQLVHRHFRDLLEHLRPGDVLVANESRVIPARLYGRRESTGGRVELLLLRQVEPQRWEALVKPGRRVRAGATILVEGRNGRSGEGVLARIVDATESGSRVVEFSEPVERLLDQLGELPLPPYIHTRLHDPERYQTVYSRSKGSAAAPTAGLHFTAALMAALRERGVSVEYVTLHIGLDTFRPLQAERVEEHRIHCERVEVSADVAERLNQARGEGRRIVAVGTTATRALESAAGAEGWQERVEPLGGAWWPVQPYCGETRLYIYPGYRFRVVDALITNFHFPRSSLLLLVSAFAGRGPILQAYREAVRLRYRFFSFGDAMLIE